MRFLGVRTVQIASLAGFSWGGSKLDEIPAAKPRMCPIQIQRPDQAQNDVLLSRKVINHLDRSNLKLRLYQYETCPFCCKVRAFLDYYGFSYEVVEVNPVTRSQIKFSNEYKKVPIIRSGEKTLTESSLIISQLATFIERPDQSLEQVIQMYPGVDSTNEKGKPMVNYPNKFFIMKGKVDAEGNMAAAREEREWREWVDNWFIHLISPNVYRSWNESLETFRWFEQVGDWHRTFPAWERVLAVYVGAAAMFLLSKTLKKKHNISDEREELRKACRDWMAAIGPNRKFLGGDQPNLADLSLYGAMNSFYGCSAFKEVILEEKIVDWSTEVTVLKMSEHEEHLELEVTMPTIEVRDDRESSPEISSMHITQSSEFQMEAGPVESDEAEAGSAGSAGTARTRSESTASVHSDTWQTSDEMVEKLRTAQNMLDSGSSPIQIIQSLYPDFNITNISHLPERTHLAILGELLDRPPKRDKLPSYNTLGDAVELFRTKKNILVLTGAGVSVSCGIPDFRSKDGIYARLRSEFPDLPDPTAMFDIRYFRSNPAPFYNFAREIFPGQFVPSVSHRFIKELESAGRLLRNYTQNIDTLEHQTGIKRVVECHGSFSKCTCTQCGHKYDGNEIREEVLEQRVAHCKHCRGVIKPNIVFFGEDLGQDFHKNVAKDKPKVDLVVVIGSSLKVRPVSMIPLCVREDVPQILINRESLPHYKPDIELLGNCDDIIRDICFSLGGSFSEMINSYDEMIAKSSPKVKASRRKRQLVSNEEFMDMCLKRKSKDEDDEQTKRIGEPNTKKPRFEKNDSRKNFEKIQEHKEEEDDDSTDSVDVLDSIKKPRLLDITTFLEDDKCLAISGNQTIFPGAEYSFDLETLKLVREVHHHDPSDSSSAASSSDSESEGATLSRSTSVDDIIYYEYRKNNLPHILVRSDSCDMNFQFELSEIVDAEEFSQLCEHFRNCE
ncbi:unnamed protein product [Caenorhabditis sp. 36 PRJEB53466]|nr:unnamed protein product [Caenorhabditis sp. 36 PRJEB53466]